MSCGGACGGSCGGGCAPATNPCAPGFALPTAGVGAQPNLENRPQQQVPLCGTLARSLISVADGIRNLYASFGLRPYVVRIIKTRWSGGRRGVGAETVISETPILPVPLASDISSLAEVNTAVGVDEFGEIVVSQISGAYTEDFLRGQDSQGRPVAVDEQFYWEIEFPPSCAGGDGDRRRFVVKGAPYYKADAFHWSVRLEKARMDRARNGETR